MDSPNVAHRDGACCIPRSRAALICHAALFLAALVPGGVRGETVCANDGQDCKVTAPARHIVTTLGYWRESLAKPVEQRIGIVSPELIDYIVRDNDKNSIPNRPHAAPLTPEFLRDVRQALDELPPAIKRLLSAKLAGISFAEDLGGTGFTEEIVGPDEAPCAGFIVLDPAVLSSRKANEWATWKENTPFRPDPHHALAAQIEAKAEDSRKNAIQYILLHEFGHVLSIGEKIHPPWTVEPQDVHSADGYPFFLLSWAMPKAGNRYSTLFDATFPQLKDVVYYFGAKLPGAQMIGVYDRLEATNFPTLYASHNPADDWAEAFVTYVHAVMMNKPFAIRIYRDGRLAKEYTSCWTDKRCEQKRKIIERFLNVGQTAAPG